MTTNSVARFKIGDKIYTTAGIDELSLKDVLRFNSEAADLGLGISFSDIERISIEFGGLTDEEAQSHPQAVLMTAVTVWASRRVSGEDVSLDDVLSTRIVDLEFLPPTEDHRPRPTQPRKGAVKKTAAKKTPSRSASARRASAGRPAGSPAKKTSASPSGPA